MTNTAVTVDGVWKSFRIYSERNQTLKSVVMRRKRSVYEEFWALRDVSFEIPEGKTFGLMGDNGSGKSTLLKCIARILQPNKGHVAIRSGARMAAMLELGSGFHPELTGRENVYLNGSILGMSKREIDDKFDAIADFAGIGSFIDQPVKNYSSGMYVRLGFSVAIHVDPDILLVDEILAVGDMSFQTKCREKFAQFREEGRTVVVVSHGLGEMRNMCDQAAWLNKGRLVDIGPATRIVDEYIDVGHQARKVETGGTRHGSGEAQVVQIELLVDGQDTRQVRTGDRVTVRLHYRATEPIPRPVFSVSFRALDGVRVWAHHSLDGDYIPDRIDGDGTIDLTIPAIPLQPGVFDVSSSLVDHSTSHSYDQWSKAIRFDVLAGVPFESGGYVTMGSQWGNVQPPRPIEPPTDRRQAFLDDQLRQLAARGEPSAAGAE